MKRALRASEEKRTIRPVIAVAPEPVFSFSRSGEQLKEKAIPIVLPPVILDVHEVTGAVRIGLFVHNNPVNRIDPLGLYNPISGPSGPVGPGSGLVDPSVYLPPLPSVPNSPGANGGNSAYQLTSQTLAGLGLGQTAAEFGSGSASIGNNLKFYPSGFYGNQSVKTMQITECAHAAGPLLFGASAAADYYGWRHGDISGEKFGVNTGFGALGLAGPEGAAIAVTYSAVDNFYPGGWEGYANDQGSILQSNMQAAPYTWSLGYPIIGP